LIEIVGSALVSAKDFLAKEICDRGSLDLDARAEIGPIMRLESECAGRFYLYKSVNRSFSIHAKCTKKCRNYVERSFLELNAPVTVKPQFWGTGVNLLVFTPVPSRYFSGSKPTGIHSRTQPHSGRGPGVNRNSADWLSPYGI
jgi:hypothetical protein